MPSELQNNYYIEPGLYEFPQSRRYSHGDVYHLSKLQYYQHAYIANERKLYQDNVQNGTIEEDDVFSGTGAEDDVFSRTGAEDNILNNIQKKLQKHRKVKDTV